VQAGNGPHLEQLLELGYPLIILVKPDDHPALFESVQEQLRAGKTEEFETTDEAGTVRGYRFLNGVPLNQSYPHLRVNDLDFWEGLPGAAPGRAPPASKGSFTTSLWCVSSNSQSNLTILTRIFHKSP
jgi:hypothetical protein